MTKNITITNPYAFLPKPGSWGGKGNPVTSLMAGTGDAGLICRDCMKLHRKSEAVIPVAVDGLVTGFEHTVPGIEDHVYKHGEVLRETCLILVSEHIETFDKWEIVRAGNLTAANHGNAEPDSNSFLVEAAKSGYTLDMFNSRLKGLAEEGAGMHVQWLIPEGSLPAPMNGFLWYRVRNRMLELSFPYAVIEANGRTYEVPPETGMATSTDALEWFPVSEFEPLFGALSARSGTEASKRIRTLRENKGNSGSTGVLDSYAETSGDEKPAHVKEPEFLPNGTCTTCYMRHTGGEWTAKGLACLSLDDQKALELGSRIRYGFPMNKRQWTELAWLRENTNEDVNA